MQEAIGQERGAIAMMAARANNLVKKVRDRLSGLVTKKVTIPMKPGSFQEFFDPLEEFEEKYN
jgi:hypothetical protein